MTLINVPLDVDEEETNNKDLLLRQSRLLYPDVEDWILEMAIEAYMNSSKEMEKVD